MKRCEYLHLLSSQPLTPSALRWSQLRVLNLGGCFKLTDSSVESIVMCEHLVHLNIATMKVTDYGLEVIANTLMYLVTVNLFGIKSITGDGIAYLCQKQPHMQSLNLRGGGDPLISYEVGQQLKVMCKATDCEVLTGKEKWEAIY